MRKTNKIYYQTSSLEPIEAKIVKVHKDGLELDKTIAYPEGGGQIGDEGSISLINDPSISIDFIDTQLKFTNPFYSENPTCRVDGIINHIVKDIESLNRFKIGDLVLISINKEKRINTSKTHSAMHLLYAAVMKLRTEIRTIGCHIKEDSGRFDFSTNENFTKEECLALEENVNNKIKEGIDIKISTDPRHTDVRYWICGEEVIPCGGTHSDNTKNIPLVTISRKNIGKSKERLNLTCL